MSKKMQCAKCGTTMKLVKRTDRMIVANVNLDVTWMLPGATRTTQWAPYVGAGPNFALSHRGIDTTNDPEADEGSRFDFSDTDFKTGFNFIAGARSRNGVFFEMKATAYGVSTIRLLGGFNF